MTGHLARNLLEKGSEKRWTHGSALALRYSVRIRIGFPLMPDGSATAHHYRPKLATVLAEGYDLGCFRKDMLAALTVAIVALPLSMAIAVASGVSPERGLYAAVIGGFLVSALGGSRYQIGGPAGAFIVLVAATVEPWLASTDFWSRGFHFRLHAGPLIGLSEGSARWISLHSARGDGRLHLRASRSAIFASQLRDSAGLKLPAAEPGPLLPKLATLAELAERDPGGGRRCGVGSGALIFLGCGGWRRVGPGC